MVGSIRAHSENVKLFKILIGGLEKKLKISQQSPTKSEDALFSLAADIFDLNKAIKDFGCKNKFINKRIRKLVVYANQVQNEQEPHCPLCFIEWKDTADKIVALSCGHLYCANHKDEIQKKCPTCQTPNSLPLPLNRKVIEKAAFLLQKIGNKASLLQPHLHNNDDEKITLETQAWQWLHSIRSDTGLVPVNLEEAIEQRREERLRAEKTFAKCLLIVMGSALFTYLGLSWYASNR